MRTLYPEEDLAAAATPLLGQRWTGTFDSIEIPKAGTLDEQLRAELTRDDGTPEWRSWVARAADHRGITV